MNHVPFPFQEPLEARARAVLLTRPVEDSLSLAHGLWRHGHRAILEPLLEIQFHPLAASPLHHHIDAILATSRHGLQGLVHALPVIPRKIPVYCVGQATARTAQTLGFKKCMATSGTVADLMNTLTEDFTEEKPRFFYPRGQNISFPLSQTLMESGFLVDEAIVYQAQPAPAFTANLIKKITQGRVGSVVFYSERTAQIFDTCLIKAGLTGATSDWTAYCVSDKIAQICSSLNFKSSVNTGTVDQEAVLATIVSQGLHVSS